MFTINELLRKRAHTALFLLLICLGSCSSPTIQQWELDTINSDCPPITYAKIYLLPCSPFNGLEAEFLYSGGEMRFFLNALMLYFTPSDNMTVPVHISFADESHDYVATCFEGNQRLLLPDEALQTVIGALLCNYEVEIQSDRYYTTLILENFASIYKTWIHPENAIIIDPKTPSNNL